MIARYYEEKRIDHAIKAFSVFQKIYPHAELHLYGFGDARDKYKTENELIRLVKELDLTESVFFRGYLINLSDEWQTLHAQLVTSRFEGFCLAIIEGMSRGVPTVAYNINYGPKDLINDNQSGFLVESGDINSLANKMQELLRDEQRFLRISKDAYNSAQKFNSKVIISEWVDVLYDKL